MMGKCSLGKHSHCEPSKGSRRRGAVLVIRDHPTTDLVGYPEPWSSFQGGNPAWCPQPLTHRAHPHSRLSSPLLSTASDPAGIHVVPDRTSSDAVPHNPGDLTMGLWRWLWGFHTALPPGDDLRALPHVFLSCLLDALCQPLGASPLHDISAPSAELMPQNGLLGAKLAVQLISPTKVKFDLRQRSLHWNDWNKPPPIRFCPVCCRVGSLGQMDGMDSKEIIISYTPQLYSSGYICQYPTPPESVSHFFTSKISTKEDTQKYITLHENGRFSWA